ncbi:metalloregulator ArsR/SmtB family transcription factor [Halorussus amylolyticus]|uniref:metalloregulator ArsR/SmtB family transcription factor n=1 Tax=Halorussus amylolyticus TaxID=1126242 RepID=UPI001047AC42|nr:metalloregulator ArsR/SmtB family transcription factor [Halorussus amylolyticus]
MDSAELLDILGNENRRRILRLLARKPCYVTEISEYLGVSPKAVIDHLRKLEDAGLVESRTDDQRRKYFSISRNLRLEVSVSPYEFGMKSAYPASKSLDVSRCRHISLNVQLADLAETPPSEGGGEADASETDADETGTGDADADRASRTDADETGASDDEAVGRATGLASELDELQQLQSELSLAQRWVHGRIADVQDRLSDALDTGTDGETRLHAEVLSAVAGGASTSADVSRAVEAPRPVVEECLDALEDRGFAERDGDEWSLAE